MQKSMHRTLQVSPKNPQQNLPNLFSVVRKDGTRSCRQGERRVDVSFRLVDVDEREESWSRPTKKGCDDLLAFFPETEEKKRRLRTNRDDLERSKRRRGRLSARSFRQTEAIRTNLGTQLDERHPPVWNLLSLLRRKSGPCSGRG